MTSTRAGYYASRTYTMYDTRTGLKRTKMHAWREVNSPGQAYCK